MTVIAVSLSVVFFLVAFVLRSVVQWRRTGDAGFRLSHSAGGLAKLASLLMIGGFLALFAGLLCDLGSAFGVVRGLDHAAIRLSGLALMMLAFGATARAQMDLRESWRIGVDPGERTDLVTDGTFGLVRNPIFTGMLAFAVGAALAVPNWLTFAGAAVVLGGLEVQVRGVEEPYLLRAHGSAYAIYMEQVGRFVPAIGRSRPDISRLNASS